MTRVFTIAILDVDEFDVGPVSDTHAAANAVNENVPNGTLVGITGFASDADATMNAIAYSLQDTAGGRFAVDATTGVITVANGSLLDAETAPSHRVTLRATSADGSFSEAMFTIQVHDVDEFDVGAITDVNPATNEIRLNAAAGTPVGLTAFAVDADATNNAITYTLANDAGGRFTIHPTTGVTTVAGPLTPGTAGYDVLIRASSQDGSSSTRLFTIAVLQADPGDFDGDGDLDGADIDALSAAAAAGTHDPQFDLTSDGLVTVADVNYWVTQIKGTILGDANLDFSVDGSDFNIWNAHKFTLSTRWTLGNFNADGSVDGSDFSTWNSHKFTSAIPPSTLEPPRG